MSPRRVAADTSRSGGRIALSMLLVLLIAVAMLLLVRAKPKPGPFDPRSGSPNGARALVLLLQAQGASVEVTRTPPKPSSVERVLVLDDRLSGAQRDALLTWIEAGGLAVVADPASTLHGGPGVDGGSIEVTGDEPSAALAGGSVRPEINVAIDQCTIDALQNLRGVFTPRGLLFPVGSDERRCFGDERHAFVIGTTLGRGVVIGLGDNHIFTNRFIRYADNSGLATALLAPQPGARVRILLGDGAAKAAADIGSGDQHLIDLVRPGVWMALLQLAIAFVVFAFARGIRVGRPVTEPRPVPVAGSEFVAAGGNLMQRAKHASRAASVMRGRLYRDLCHRVRLPTTTAIDVLDREVANRCGTDAGEVTSIFHAEVTDQQQLLEFSRRLHHLRSRTAPATPTSTTPSSTTPGSQP